VISQVVLSFGIAFAVVPLVTLNSDARVMGEFAARRPLRVAGWLIAAAVVTLNVALLYLTFTGRA
jgi:manganese transport protein